jgi:predicted kinase
VTKARRNTASKRSPLKAADKSPPAPVATLALLPPLPDRALVLLIGIPGSGKSTYATLRNLPTVSTDALRLLLFDNVSEQRFQDHVFSVLRHVIRARLDAGIARTFVDATNLGPHERKPLISLATQYGYPACALYFDTPLEICMQRNRQRGRLVPEEVLLRMTAKLRPPELSEGFTTSYRITDERGTAVSFAGMQ